ncbi:hypothetical protein KI387_003190, partial [Taxus chinensis]
AQSWKTNFFFFLREREREIETRMNINTSGKGVRKPLKSIEICKPHTSNEVKVFQIVSPPVIKTSVTDFKQVVQKLTGKEGSSSIQSHKNVIPVPLELPNYGQPQNSNAFVHDEVHYQVPVCDGDAIQKPGFIIE